MSVGAMGKFAVLSAFAISGFLVFGATPLDLNGSGTGHVTFHFDTWDTEAAYRRTLDGDPGYSALWARRESL